MCFRDGKKRPNLIHTAGMAAQKATELRRLRIDVENEHAALKARQEELEKFFPCRARADLARGDRKGPVIYWVSLRSQPAAQDPRRQELIRRVRSGFRQALG